MMVMPSCEDQKMKKTTFRKGSKYEVVVLFSSISVAIRVIHRPLKLPSLAAEINNVL